jgi:hypothetical protein
MSLLLLHTVHLLVSAFFSLHMKMENVQMTGQ